MVSSIENSLSIFCRCVCTVLILIKSLCADKITIQLADHIVVESRNIDLLGRPVFTQKTKSKTVQTMALYPGIYVLEVQTKSGQTYREHFVKQ